MATREKLINWRFKYLNRTPEEELFTHFNGKVAVLCGVPGVGKSTLGQQLAALVPGAVYFPEFIQRELLEAYLTEEGRKKLAFTYQVLMFRECIHIYTKAIAEAQRGKFVIVDSPPQCNNAFTRTLWQDGLINDEEYKLYQDVADESVRTNGLAVHRPDYLLYLDCNKDVALQRIKKRGRPGEYEAYKKGNFLPRLRDVFAELLSEELCLVFDYDEDNTDTKDTIPRSRLIEILGLIRDRTFQRRGLCESANPHK